MKVKARKFPRSRPVTLSEAEINHLRRMLGYVRCEIGQSPEEYVATMREIAAHGIKPCDSAAESRVVDGYQKAKAVPQYIREGLKALEKALLRERGEVVEGDALDAATLLPIGDAP